MFGPIRAVVFDLDGTLVDTMPAVTRGLAHAVQVGRGEAVVTQELIQSFGPAPQDVLKRWVPADRLEIAYEAWLAYEKTLGAADMRVFPEIEELLAGLSGQGIPLALFTGRDRRSALEILVHHNWLNKYFVADKIICGDDGLPTKPDPAALVKICKTFNLPAAETLMVGDHTHDMVAGVAAGCKTAAVLWDLPAGQGTQRSRFREAWSKWDSVACDLRLVSPRSLLKWISGEISTL